MGEKKPDTECECSALIARLLWLSPARTKILDKIKGWPEPSLDGPEPCCGYRISETITRKEKREK
jgi:hypothetical protein